MTRDKMGAYGSVQRAPHGNRMVEPLHVITANLLEAALAITLNQGMPATLTIAGKPVKYSSLWDVENAGD
jgi:hypothetical protein